MTVTARVMLDVARGQGRSSIIGAARPRAHCKMSPGPAATGQVGQVNPASARMNQRIIITRRSSDSDTDDKKCISCSLATQAAVGSVQ